MNLLEYSFFSLCEEVDIFYCRNMEADILSETFNDDNLREKIAKILSVLESNNSTDDESNSNFR